MASPSKEFPLQHTPLPALPPPPVSRTVQIFQDAQNKGVMGSQMVQAAFKSITLAPCSKPAAGVPFVTLTTVMLTAGAAILRWLAQSVEARGLGEGTSILITLSIVTSELLLMLTSAVYHRLLSALH